MSLNLDSNSDGMDEAEKKRFVTWQGLTFTTLLVGYAGYYVCRSVLPVASNSLMNDPNLKLDEEDYGFIGAVGIYMYAFGKLFNGLSTEYLGGRFMFICGMALSVLCVVGYGLAAGLTAFVLLWGANRFVQSMGWVALVQITGRWYKARTLASVTGLLSLSYLFGDALARLYLGTFRSFGMEWRELFFVAAASLGLIALVGTFTLKGSPGVLGLPEPPPPPENVFGSMAAGRTKLWGLLKPLFSSPLFWIVCCMNMGLTAIRETFNFWTPRYLEKGVGVSDTTAGLLSFVFPLLGAVASVMAGVGADRAKGRYGLVMVPCLIVAVGALAILAFVDFGGRPSLALLTISMIALFLMGPYSYCSGVMAINLGGKRAAAASAGMIDAAGYLCGAYVIGLAGKLAKPAILADGTQVYSYSTLFRVLFGLGVVTLFLAVSYGIVEQRRRKRKNLG